MTGYQEILTDPSYSGQLVTMTYPLIGNYGVNEEDRGVRGARGRRVRGQGGLPDLFVLERGAGLARHTWQSNGIVAIAGVDTRALTRHITLRGGHAGGHRSGVPPP